jgi:hypothetical protein
MGPRKERRPDISPEAREARLVSLAMDLAERQLRDGSAPATTVSHFLKMGSSREALEQEKLLVDTDLSRARSEALASAARIEILYADAIAAIKRYQGQESMEDEEL